VPLQGAFDSLTALAEFGGGIEGNIEAADAPQRQAIELDIDPLAHAGILSRH
jgi:hypothetical protein